MWDSLRLLPPCVQLGHIPAITVEGRADTAHYVVVNVKENIFVLYPLKFSVWWAVNQTDNGQVSRRKDSLFTRVTCIHTRMWGKGTWKRRLNLGLPYGTLIGKWEGEKSTMMRAINGFLEEVGGVKGTYGEADEPRGEQLGGMILVWQCLLECGASSLSQRRLGSLQGRGCMTTEYFEEALLLGW